MKTLPQIVRRGPSALRRGGAVLKDGVGPAGTLQFCFGQRCYSWRASEKCEAVLAAFALRESVKGLEAILNASVN